MTYSISTDSTLFFFSSRRRHTRWPRDWSSDVCSSDLSTYFELNGTKVTKRDYDDFIADEIGTPADIRKAMQLWGIVHLSPGELRQEILSIAGDVTLQQVADAHPDVAPALELVEDGDLTKTRKNLDREIRAISPQKTELQNRIDENQHALDTLDKPENIVDLEQAVTKAEASRSEEHTSELQSRGHLVCRLLLEKKNT